MRYQKFATYFSVLLIPCILAPNCPAQTKRADYFPKFLFGLSTGYFKSSIEDFARKNNQEPLFGAFAGLELLNFGNTAIYGIFHFNHFVARLEGEELIKWQQDYFNFGLRYSYAHAFLGRPNAQLWFASGLSRLGLSRKDFRRKTVLIWEPSGPRRLVIDESVIDKWGSSDMFIEIGQLIPFELDMHSNLAFMWILKYDRGRDEEQRLGGLSFLLGLAITLFYH